jgi:hypothetical protein
MRRGRFAKLTDEKAVDLVGKADDFMSKINFHVDNIEEGLQNASDQIRDLKATGGGTIDASIILQKNVTSRVEALHRFLGNVLKQLE